MPKRDPTITELRRHIQKIAKDVRQIRELADAMLMMAETRAINRVWIEGVCSKIIMLDNDISRKDIGIKKDLRKVTMDMRKAKQALEKLTKK